MSDSGFPWRKNRKIIVSAISGLTIGIIILIFMNIETFVLELMVQLNSIIGLQYIDANLAC
jgi:hypothetical protein